MEILKLINATVNEFAYNNKIAKSIGKPTLQTIETTNKCNLACGMCPRQFMTRKVGTMNMELFKKIVDEVKQYQNYIILHLMGEPLLDEHMIERINYCEDNGIRVNISTNGTFLDSINARKILESKLSELILSVDATTKEVYSKIRVKGDFEIMRENYHNFFRIKNEEYPDSRLKTIIQFIKMNSNIHQVEDFRREWGPENPSELRVKGFSTFADQHKQITQLAAMKYRYQPDIVETRPPCFYLWKSMIALWDGKVVTCCRDYDGKIVMGDLNKEKLIDIWKSDKLKRIRQEHLKGDFNNGLCDNCYDTSMVVPKMFYPFNSKAFTQAKKKLLSIDN